MPIGTGYRCARHNINYAEECYRCVESERDALRARVKDLEDHTVGLEATIEHLAETMPECKPVIFAYITGKLKINLT